MIEIKRWDTGAVIYTSQDATSVAYAVIEAVRAGVDLDRANLDVSLDRANLDGASLDRANLDGASLDAIRDDIWAILDASPNEVPTLLAALRAGKFDGSHYEGECACLVGTIANARGVSSDAIPGLIPNPERPAERWAMAIAEGDTPETNPVAKITAGWLETWAKKRAEAINASP